MPKQKTQEPLSTRLNRSLAKRGLMHLLMPADPPGGPADPQARGTLLRKLQLAHDRPDIPDVYLSLRESADLCGVVNQTIRKWIQRGVVDATKHQHPAKKKTTLRRAQPQWAVSYRSLVAHCYGR